MILERKTVMHVDDDAMVSRVVASLLTKAGYYVVTVDSAMEGLRKLSSVQPHVIVLDLNMAGMSGLTFLRQIATPEGKTKVPTIVFTAFSEMTDETATQLAAAVLRKPIDLEKLPETIARLIGPPKKA
jgi:CheY-like chemotaxis protein